MANIDSLKKSITELPYTDAINLLIDIRQARRTEKERKAVRRATSRTKKPKQSKNKLLSVIGGLTPEQARALMEELNEAE